jgi:hypoxanthine phosphoribosyltransferase
MTAPTDVRDRDPDDVDQFDLSESYRSDLDGVLIPANEIQERVARIARDVSADYHGNEDFYPLCILKGAMRFFVDLNRGLELEVPYREGIVHTTRYHGGVASDTTQVTFFHEEAIAGKDVLLVEDIVDEGHTLATLVDRIEEYDPRSVEIAVVFDKVENRQVDVDVAYTGFVIPDDFVVGYGLDYDEKYRDLRHLGVVETDA